jgi:DNA-binding NtrC family response regulator
LRIKPNILAIDDNNDIADLIKLALQMNGFNVVAYDNPFLALQCFKSNPKKFTLVISDATMPGMSGFELIANMRQVEPNFKAILMTAYDLDHIIVDLKKYNYEIQEILKKPLSITNLCEVVEKHLNNC